MRSENTGSNCPRTVTLLPNTLCTWPWWRLLLVLRIQKATPALRAALHRRRPAWRWAPSGWAPQCRPDLDSMNWSFDFSLTFFHGGHLNQFAWGDPIRGKGLQQHSPCCHWCTRTPPPPQGGDSWRRCCWSPLKCFYSINVTHKWITESLIALRDHPKICAYYLIYILELTSW